RRCVPEATKARPGPPPAPPRSNRRTTRARPPPAPRSIASPAERPTVGQVPAAPHPSWGPRESHRGLRGPPPGPGPAADRSAACGAPPSASRPRAGSHSRVRCSPGPEPRNPAQRALASRPRRVRASGASRGYHSRPSALMYPQIFGKYMLQGELASGGMARVFVATLRGAGGFEKRLAVKQIRPELARDPHFVEHFIQEAK